MSQPVHFLFMEQRFTNPGVIEYFGEEDFFQFSVFFFVIRKNQKVFLRETVLRFKQHLGPSTVEYCRSLQIIFLENKGSLRRLRD